MKITKLKLQQIVQEELEAVLDEVSSEKQRRWACAQKDPKFDEMCKDIKISKKKLAEIIKGEIVEILSGKEEI